MTTMIAAYSSDGCIGRCDAKCYDAKGPRCTCICGGRNHGKGFNAALENCKRDAEQMVVDWYATHPETERVAQPMYALLEEP